MDSLDYGSNKKATYLKITLTKLVLFLNAECYLDYLAHFAQFVAREGNRDRYTDSWTALDGKKLLFSILPSMLLVCTDRSIFVDFSGRIYPKDVGSSNCVGFRSPRSNARLLDTHFAWFDGSLSSLVLQKL